jgi:hypothetical protein
MRNWLIIAILLLLLAGSLWVGYLQWILIDFEVPVWSWVAMAFAAGLSILLGIGLMGLIFYSSRMGYDEPPQVIEPSDESRSANAQSTARGGRPT